MAEAINKAKDASFVLARHALSLTYEDIPEDVRAITKSSILDMLGVIVASSITPGIRELVMLIKAAGGKEESSILGFGGRVPAWMAAFANGAMAHCLDYDDEYDPGSLHPSSSTIPASIAMAERIGAVNGKKFITAVCLGNDLVCRLGLSIRWKFDWLLSPLFGIFGATLSCGKLLSFDEMKYVHSFGIALTQASTTMEVAYSPGSELRGMYASFSAKGAVLAALMGNIGIAGPNQSLEGMAGLYNVYFNGEYDRNLLLDNFGKKFEHINTSFKPWPTSRETHAYIDGVLSLIKEHNVQPEHIDEVLVYVDELAEHCFIPLDERRKPDSLQDAKFSIPFCLAVALVKRRVTIRDFTPETIKDPAVLGMAQKINSKREPGFDAKGIAPGRVDIKTMDKKVYSKLVEFSKGHPKNPMTTEEIIAKFKECMTFSPKPISEGNVEQVIDMVMNLEKVTSVGQIISLLC
jgi:2-methylcitrate dehydratase PrpD